MQLSSFVFVPMLWKWYVMYNTRNCVTAGIWVWLIDAVKVTLSFLSHWSRQKLIFTRRCKWLSTGYPQIIQLVAHTGVECRRPLWPCTRIDAQTLHGCGEKNPAVRFWPIWLKRIQHNFLCALQDEQITRVFLQSRRAPSFQNKIKAGILYINTEFNPQQTPNKHCRC